MAITATITNLVREENGIRVFWSYSEGGEANDLFPYNTTGTEIRTGIKTKLDELNSRQGKFETLSRNLAGVVLT